jgi:hypothetical protein
LNRFNVFFVAAVIAALAGCAAMLPKIESKHREGYSKLVQSHPECVDPDLKIYSGCLSGAQMLEARTPQKATTIFISSWEKGVLKMQQEKEQIEKKKDIVDSIIAVNLYNDSLKEFESVNVSVLQEIYSKGVSPYCKAMANQLDIIDPNSRASFDTFREANLKSMSLE